MIPWDEEVDYRQHAHTLGDDGGKYLALQETGPRSGNAINPTATQSATDPVWRMY